MKFHQTNDNTKQKRIFLVDDHPLVREWLGGMIAQNADLALCGEADDASAVISAVAAARADLVIVDLSMPRSSGLELIKDLRVQSAQLRIMVLSAHEDLNLAERALRAGANGYVMKSQSGSEIIEAIRMIIKGKFYTTPTLSSQLAQRLFASPLEKVTSPEEQLSDRQLIVFQLRGQGRTTKEVADILKVSVKTVASYEARIKEKLGLNNVSELTREAVLWNSRKGGL